MVQAPILIVDDEPINRGVLRHILERDYRLLFAATGAEALSAAAAADRPGLVLLDIMLPDMDGYAVCRTLKSSALTEDIPVIFVTGASDPHSEEKGFDVGGVDYLTKPVSAAIVRARVRTHLSLIHVKELTKSRRDAIFMLGKAGHYNDADTGLHVWRMAAYAARLAAEAGWTTEQCELLELAAPMHDTGKIGIPDAILRKPGSLDAAEWTLMKTHCWIGYEILSGSDAPVFQLAAEVALYHHERWDGSGYLRGLAGEAIPQSARIVAVADVFDALGARRPYKDAWPLESAVAILHKGAGRHFDPSLIRAFDACLPDLLDIKKEWDERERAGRQ